MSRSVKKGPFVHASLLKKIYALNAANDKKVAKAPGLAALLLFRLSLVTPLRFMTDANMFRYSLPRIW